MKRRNFILTVGAASAASAAAVGTSAFSSVEANRLAEVEVVGDADAYLSIEPTDGPNGEYAEVSSGGVLEISMDDGNESVDGDGVNPQSTTVAKEVFEIRNQGTQDISVDLDGTLGDPVVFPDDDLLVSLLPDDESLPFELELSSGESQTIAVVAAAFDGIVPSDVEPPEESFTIIAEGVEQ